MSLHRSARVAGVLLVAVGLASPAAPGQDRDKPQSGKAVASEPVVRQVYSVQGASVKDLAAALTQHFHAETSFRAVPDAGSNTILLSGSRATLKEATAVLREIDRQPRGVRVEVLCLELAAKADGEAGSDAKALDTAGLAAEFVSFALETRVKVRPGSFVLAEGNKTASRVGQSQRLILVTANVDATNPKGGK